jgi:hypothetical protein
MGVCIKVPKNGWLCQACWFELTIFIGFRLVPTSREKVEAWGLLLAAKNHSLNIIS